MDLYGWINTSIKEFLILERSLLMAVKIGHPSPQLPFYSVTTSRILPLMEANFSQRLGSHFAPSSIPSTAFRQHLVYIRYHRSSSCGAFGDSRTKSIYLTTLLMLHLNW